MWLRILCHLNKLYEENDIKMENYYRSHIPRTDYMRNQNVMSKLKIFQIPCHYNKLHEDHEFSIKIEYYLRSHVTRINYLKNKNLMA